MDQEANIIVGATFDEGLDGIIRVSVVATGIDQIALPAQHPSSIDSRLAELTQKLRSNTQRVAERQNEDAAAAAKSPVKLATPQPAPLPSPAANEDVTIRPMPQKPSLFIEPATETHGTAPEAPVPAAFIPPVAERTPLARAPRMPRVEDFPKPAQNEIRASRGEMPEPIGPEKRRSLLQRLASVGLGRRGEEPEPAAESRQALPPLPRPAPRAAESRQPDPVSEYAKRPAAPRPAPQGLDQHGRPAPVHNLIDEDQLEIPAFLRRQSN